MNKAQENRFENYRSILDATRDMSNKILDVSDKLLDVTDTVSDLVNAEFRQKNAFSAGHETNGAQPVYMQQRMVEDEEGNCSTLAVTLTPAKFIRIEVCPLNDPDDQWTLSLTLSETKVLRSMMADAIRTAAENAADKSVWGEF